MQMPRLRAAIGSLACLVLASAASAGSVGLRWDPLAGATGYRVHYGPASGGYTQFKDVGSATSTTLTGLSNCANYYIAVKAYNSQGGESASYSNELTGWSRPEITSTTPVQVKQGDQLTLNLSGANFQTGAQLNYQVVGLPSSVSGEDLVRLENVAVVSCNQIQAQLTVEPTARGQRAMEVGSFSVDFEVVNPTTVFGTGTGQLTVQFAEPRADVNRSDTATLDRVDGKDLVWLAYAFGSNEGQANHNPDADLNGDGMVDGEDLSYIATRFGRCWTGSAWNVSACQ